MPSQGGMAGRLLFAEGDFTATYRFALFISLADLPVELGFDDGGELPLTTLVIEGTFHPTVLATGST